MEKLTSVGKRDQGEASMCLACGTAAQGEGPGSLENADLRVRRWVPDWAEHVMLGGSGVSRWPAADPWGQGGGSTVTHPPMKGSLNKDMFRMFKKEK